MKHHPILGLRTKFANTTINRAMKALTENNIQAFESELMKMNRAPGYIDMTASNNETLATYIAKIENIDLLEQLLKSASNVIDLNAKNVYNEGFFDIIKNTPHEQKFLELHAKYSTPQTQQAPGVPEQNLAETEKLDEAIKQVENKETGEVIVEDEESTTPGIKASTEDTQGVDTENSNSIYPPNFSVAEKGIWSIFSSFHNPSSHDIANQEEELSIDDNDYFKYGIQDQWDQWM